jgi:hypothetical protein
MTDDEDTETPGRAARIVRGVSRFLAERGESCLTEFTLKTGRRVDVIALDRKGGITVVEVKSSVADFRSDRKWSEYLKYCDLFFFAVDADFPLEILPSDCGIILADAYGAAQSRHASLRADQRQPIAWIYRSRLDSRLALTLSVRIRYAAILPRIP